LFLPSQNEIKMGRKQAPPSDNTETPRKALKAASDPK
jgi:hypothetical protein